ncbi:hypothetical protein, partial [Stenotrophomonas maltophilia]|uniref:hypothetical protein n=1 Tax=Stenotrophomonas maltophilia TaxID=40324 RepID=UPI001F4CCA9E
MIEEGIDDDLPTQAIGWVRWWNRMARSTRIGSSQPTSMLIASPWCLQAEARAHSANSSRAWLDST